MLLPTFSFLFLVPKDWSSSAQLLSVWSPFRFRFASAHPYECFLSGFLAEGAHLWLSALPYQILRWSCCCQLSRCKFLSLRTGLVLLLRRRVGKLSGFPSLRLDSFQFSRPTGLVCIRSIQTGLCFFPFVAIRTCASSLSFKTGFTFSSESGSDFLLPVRLSLFLCHLSQSWVCLILWIETCFNFTPTSVF